VTYDPERPPPPTIACENPAFTAWVERRATDLCTNPDAHPADETARPCFHHLRAARAQASSFWRARGGWAGRPDP
jgi:hypothetical protein